MDKNITVSVFLMTYNHDKFISQALDSVLMQKVNFHYEIVLGEDCSTDKTREIVVKYAERYPEKFKLILQKTNVGAINNQNEVYANCTGKYIAMCEGDDYWTDPLKLQKQVDFLEENENVSIVCHNVERLDYTTKKLNYVEYYKEDLFLNENEIIKAGGKSTPTLSYVFRSEYLINAPDWVFNSPVGDIPLMYYLMSNGKVYYFKNLMGVYRENVPGSWTINKKKNNFWKDFIFRVKFTVFIQKFNEYSHAKYKSELNSVYYNGNIAKTSFLNLAAYFYRIQSRKF